MRIGRDKFMEKVVEYVNERINIPFISERTEARIFRSIILLVLDAIDALLDEKYEE